jgi:hypothetical protein
LLDEIVFELAAPNALDEVGRQACLRAVGERVVKAR